MLDEAFLAVANHLLRNAEWARARLGAHAGKRVCIRVSPLSFHFTIDTDGLLVPRAAEAPIDATLEVPASRVPAWLVQPDAATRAARVSGDADLAEAISFVAANLRWDFEEDLSRLVGDVAAHRIGEAIRSLERWRRSASASVAANVAEYLTEERGVLPTRLRAESFLREVDDLRDAVERLEKRIAQLENGDQR